MNACYSQAESPLLPTPITENTLCAAYSVHAWYRAIVLSSDTETDTSYVKFLDYGGFAYVENSKLRQIRGDFMLLPFQAAECMLANVKSLNGELLYCYSAGVTVITCNLFICMMFFTILSCGCRKIERNRELNMLYRICLGVSSVS